MAVKACPECGQKISTGADACPSCGYPLAKKRKQHDTQLGCLILLVPFGLITFVIANAPPGEKGATTETTTTTNNAFPHAAPIENYIKHDAYGCMSQGDLERALRLYDRSEMTAYLRNQCVPLLEGWIVTLDDTAILKGEVCVRPKDTTACLWTIREALGQREKEK
jgi:hypothetical protein